ncbi:MAG: TauD/TfdA family dioxygenase [Gammaproteobacteria bacterium]|nr:TauD/TfdA family dioxygenase [Gammaproteobacteria bacterium]
MQMKRLEPVEERSVWTAADLAADPSWRHRLSAAEIEELDQATRRAIAGGLKAGEFSREDFELPTLGPRIGALVDEVETGRGVAMLRGVPVERYDADAIRVLYWGFGVHAGIPISQNSKGQLISEVTDRGNSYADINARGFATNAELSAHVDTSDMTTLLCLRTARSGGQSRVVSSTAVYNVVLAEHPEYLDVLYRGFHNDLRGEGRTGDINELTEQRVPVYSYHAGRVSCSFNYRMIEGGAVKSGVPLSAQERAALDFMREVAARETLAYGFSLEPGDIQMVSNHSVFHSRTAFVDHDEPDRKRCLLRFWMTLRDGRPLATAFADRYNTGPRGGVAVGEGARYVF